MINDTSKKKKLIKKGLIVIPILIVILSIAGINSFNKPDKIDNSNQNDSDNNKKLAIYLENDSGEYELSSDRKFPKKCYVLDTEKTTCKNGGTITQDPTTKSINGSFSKADSCNLYFKKEIVNTELSSTSLTAQLISKSNPVSVTDYNSGTKSEMYTFEHLATEQTGALTDYRYIGNTPNNYITFNEETWRIIGVFTNEDECGNKTQNIKIIRDASLGSMTWDRKSDGTNINEWPTSSLSSMLNGDYINKGSSFDYTWYNSSGTAKTTTINGLNSTAQNQVSSVKWYLGGNSVNLKGLGGPDYYSFERGTETCVTTGNCSVQTRSTNVIAKVGLMYPSDYLYTYALGVDNTCYSNGSGCTSGTPSSGWLFNSSYQWTITPRSSNANGSFRVSYTGFVDYISVNITNGVRPSLYLRSDIEITSGDGSSGNPYVLSP